MNNIALVQARMGSSRLPGKVMMKCSNLPLIEILLKRLSLSKNIDKIVVVTSQSKKDTILYNYIKKIGFPVFKGSENNVLDRFYKAAKKYNAKNIIRITGDCPLLDHKIVDSVIESFNESNSDYASNTNPPTFPDGLDVEVFSFEILKEAWNSKLTNFDREHVTSFMIKNNYCKKINISNHKNYSAYRLTLDQIADFKLIDKIFKHFYPNIYFSWKKIVKLLDVNYEKFNFNHRIARNEGSKIGSGQKLWIRAKNIIPGANMILSKRSEMFLPEKWPSYYSKASGCNIWDLDNNKFVDMSLMGVGTNILGYNDPTINKAVLSAVNKGNMTTLNCPEEVFLAEELIKLHPWADMVKFARSGGEANSIAIRIARAASGKDKVAFCGYHGWHDWYLASVLKDKNNLSEHLIKGIKSKGVPKNLTSTAFPFKFNDIKSLEKIMVSQKEIGVIKMEVQRNNPPKEGFLRKVREIASKYNCVLIFDECTSGFRQTFGGIHKLYDITPDMAVFGKALGNGYAITSVIGKKEIMNFAQDTFISSTFWSERIGPTAALATLKVMEQVKSWEIITKKGNYIRNSWLEIAKNHDIKIDVGGLPSLSIFVIKSKDFQFYKTFITQEMLKKGFLASNSIYVSTKHSTLVINNYLNILNDLFKVIKKCEEGKDIKKLLHSPVSHKGFSRLN